MRYIDCIYLCRNEFNMKVNELNCIKIYTHFITTNSRFLLIILVKFYFRCDTSIATNETLQLHTFRVITYCDSEKPKPLIFYCNIYNYKYINYKE